MKNGVGCLTGFFIWWVSAIFSSAIFLSQSPPPSPQAHITARECWNTYHRLSEEGDEDKLEEHSKSKKCQKAFNHPANVDRTWNDSAYFSLLSASLITFLSMKAINRSRKKSQS